MKHLKKINEWKEDTPETRRIDEENINEIKDLFLELSDLGCKLNIKIDNHIVESYNIEYYLENSLGFSVDTQNHESLEQEILKNKQNIVKLTEYMNLSHEFMKRLVSASYKISYFQNGYEWVRNDEVISSKIRVTKLS
jgi:hypothetical protein